MDHKKKTHSQHDVKDLAAAAVTSIVDSRDLEPEKIDGAEERYSPSPTETAYKKKRIIPAASCRTGALGSSRGGSDDLRRVSAYCVSDSLSLKGSYHHVEKLGLNPVEHKEFFYFLLKKDPSSPPEIVIKMLDAYRINALDHKLVDDMQFQYSSNRPTSIYQDKVTLSSYDIHIKIAMSHSISQSVKLSSFEENLEKIIEETKHVPQHFAVKGKNAINLHSNLLDTPNFVWEFQQYESYHQMTEKYLEIKPRVRTLNHRLMVVRDLIDMCRSDLEARGSYRLEIIVIVLIFLELVFMVLDYLSDLY
eukprot:gene7464-8733_t